MQRKEPMKAILTRTRGLWDLPTTRPSVRENFRKVLLCRTEALGVGVYASETEHKEVFHTCKSRSCSSCGHRATIQWQREQWASLPDIKYAGIVFTMPDVLWPFFREDRKLLSDLPVLSAEVVRRWAKEKYGAEVMIMVVRHTFGRHLNFNPHLHVLVSACGLRSSEIEWISVHFDQKEMMKRWRYAVITYLRAALSQQKFTADSQAVAGMKKILTQQYERWWNVHVDRCTTKEHFLRYAARYVRRPPVAQYRLLEDEGDTIRFRTKDHRLKREVLTTYQPEDFVVALGHHVQDHYQHSIRYFGLLAPRTKGLTAPAIFAILGQRRRPKPRRVGWAYSIKKAFGVDPLLDCQGKRLRLIARRRPSLQPTA